MEESTQPAVKGIAIKWGLIYGFIGIILFVIIDISGLSGNQAISWLSYVVFIVLLVLAHKEFKSNGDGFMSYVKGLGIGTLIAVVSSVISSVFSFIYVSFINTDFIESIKETQIAKMEEQGLSDAEIDRAMGFSEAFMTPVGIVVMGLLGTVFICFVISLLVAIFTKKQEPESI
ncbi:MAG: DUF4199 domain-containing protein [Bacteroidota bacterium]